MPSCPRRTASRSADTPPPRSARSRRPAARWPGRSTCTHPYNPSGLTRYISWNRAMSVPPDCAGGVDQDVDAAVVREGGVDEGEDGVVAADVDARGEGLVAEGGDFGCDRVDCGGAGAGVRWDRRRGRAGGFWRLQRLCGVNTSGAMGRELDGVGWNLCSCALLGRWRFAGGRFLGRLLLPGRFVGIRPYVDVVKLGC